MCATTIMPNRANSIPLTSTRNSSSGSAARRYAIPNSSINSSKISQRSHLTPCPSDRITMTAVTTMAAHRKVLFLSATLTNPIVRSRSRHTVTKAQAGSTCVERVRFLTVIRRQGFERHLQNFCGAREAELPAFRQDFVCERYSQRRFEWGSNCATGRRRHIGFSEQRLTDVNWQANRELISAHLDRP